MIHTNARVDVKNDKYLQQLSQQQDVIMLDDRVDVKWGGYSLFDAFLKLMRAAINNTDGEYIHLSSDSCYPIKTIAYIDQFFEENKGKEFITYEELPTSTLPYGGMLGLDYYNVHDVLPVKKSMLFWEFNRAFVMLQFHLKLKRKNPPGWGPYYFGSTWWSLSRKAVAYCLETIDNTPGFEKRFRHTRCFEENCLQTILLNSPFKDKIVNDNKRYIDWNNWKPRNGNIPANLDITDYDKLLDSDNLFARKIVGPYSIELKEKLSSHLDISK